MLDHFWLACGHPWSAHRRIPRRRVAAMSSRSTLFSATCVHCSSVRGPKSAHSWRMWRGLRHRASDRAGLQALGDDDLMRAVDGDLGVVAGDHRTGSGRLNAAVGIGEIALRTIGWPAVGTRDRACRSSSCPRMGPARRHLAAASWPLPRASPWRRECARAVLPCWRPNPASRRRADQHRGRDPPPHPSPRRWANQADTSAASLFSVSSMRP